MSEKSINFLARDYESIREELIKFSQQYYPQLTDDFNDSTVGSWFLDLVAAVGDDLNYAIDRAAQETNVNSANLRSTVLNLARSMGLKIPGRKSSMCEVQFSCILPVLDDKNNSLPLFDYAPIIQRTSTVAAGNYTFELMEDVDFADQFNSEGYSNRTFSPLRDSNGNVTSYTVTKSTLVVNGTSKVYKKVLYPSDIKPFMEIVLPEENVTNVESIIFKETSNYSIAPKIYEYYINREEFKVGKDAVVTHRFFECDSLADTELFMPKQKDSGITIENLCDADCYDDDTETGESGSTRTTRYYKGAWVPVKQKFITEYTDNGYMKIIFGAGNSYTVPDPSSTSFAQYMSTKILNNDMLGVLPKVGWTMFILYRVGGGNFTNLGPGAINQITRANVDWSNAENATNGSIRGNVISSLSVTNTTPAIGGKDAPSVEEIKALIKYNSAAQNRAVTVKDYLSKLASMPPKYGCPFRANVGEFNNKVIVAFLGLDQDGKLSNTLPSTIQENIKEYMRHYRHIGDYLDVRSGRIYNLGVMVDAFVDKNYNAPDVINNIIEETYSYMDVNNHSMGDSIFVGDLLKKINQIDGVLGIIDLKIYAMTTIGDASPLPTKDSDDVACGKVAENPFDGEAKEVDLQYIDNVLVNDYDSMFEIKDKSKHIKVRIKMA